MKIWICIRYAMFSNVHIISHIVVFTGALTRALSILTEGRSQRSGQVQRIWIASDMKRIPDPQEYGLLLNDLNKIAGKDF